MRMNDKINEDGIIEFLYEGGEGDEAKVNVELRTKFQGIGGTIITEEGAVTALRMEHSGAPKSGHNMFLRHMLIKKLEDFFSFKLTQKVKIILSSSEKDYMKITSNKIPEWSSGVAFLKERAIVLKPGKYYNPKIYRETLIHELTHIYVSDKIGSDKLPIWLNEGQCI